MVVGKGDPLVDLGTKGGEIREGEKRPGGESQERRGQGMRGETPQAHWLQHQGGI